VAVLDLQKLLELDMETRVALVQELSIVKDASNDGDLPLSTGELETLDERVREDDSDHDAAISWREARERVHKR
jgi:hypothetical protein